MSYEHEKIPKRRDHLRLHKIEIQIATAQNDRDEYTPAPEQYPAAGEAGPASAGR